MNTEIIEPNMWPLTLVVLSRSRVAGEKLLATVDKTPFTQSFVTNMSAAMKDIEARSKPHILLIDHALEDGRVMTLVKQLRLKFSHSQLSILCVVKNAESELLFPLLQNGADDFLLTPVSKDALSARLLVCSLIIQREYALSQALIQDSLTGLANRQRFLDQASPLYASAKRDQIELLVAMIAPDHLGVINSTYGQEIGDGVLKGMASILDIRKRDTDILCRYDGSRFCLLTVNLQENHLITFLDDILASFQAHEFESETHIPSITGSIGVTGYLGHNISDMFDQAEKALIQAREEGYNRFSFFNDAQVDMGPLWSRIN